MDGKLNNLFTSPDQKSSATIKLKLENTLDTFSIYENERGERNALTSPVGGKVMKIADAFEQRVKPAFQTCLDQIPFKEIERDPGSVDFFALVERPLQEALNAVEGDPEARAFNSADQSGITRGFFNGLRANPQQMLRDQLLQEIRGWFESLKESE